MTNVLALTRYAERGSSSRYRLLQYLPYLQDNGFKVDVHPLLDNEYVERLYNGQRPSKKYVAKAYANRLRRLLSAARYDVIWIEKEAVPFLPGWIERLLLGHKIGYILDYDDAVFHRYDSHSNPLVRRVLGGKYASVMRGAAIVVAGNPYIAEKAKEFGATTVRILPTVVDLGKYGPARYEHPARPAFGWIGAPVTAKYLEIVQSVFERSSGVDKRKFISIGSGPLPWDDADVTVMPWSESGEVEDLRRLSVGIMPLVDSPFERGKCGLKLLQYMAVGLPVIASPVGVNVDIVEHGVNGFLASTQEEWESAVSLLESDSELRERMGRVGRQKVESEYSLGGAAPKLADILNSASRGEKVGTKRDMVKQ